MLNLKEKTKKGNNVIKTINMEDIIDYVKNNQIGEYDWDLELLQRDFEETTAELFGFDSWEEGIRLCGYDKINYFLGDFASIEKITIDESMWK